MLFLVLSGCSAGQTLLDKTYKSTPFAPEEDFVVGVHVEPANLGWLIFFWVFLIFLMSMWAWKEFRSSRLPVDVKSNVKKNK
jgi:hypothetical protein